MLGRPVRGVYLSVFVTIMMISPEMGIYCIIYCEWQTHPQLPLLSLSPSSAVRSRRLTQTRMEDKSEKQQLAEIQAQIQRARRGQVRTSGVVAQVCSVYLDVIFRSSQSLV